MSAKATALGQLHEAMAARFLIKLRHNEPIAQKIIELIDEHIEDELEAQEMKEFVTVQGLSAAEEGVIIRFLKDNAVFADKAEDMQKLREQQELARQRRQNRPRVDSVDLAMANDDFQHVSGRKLQ